MDSYEGSSSKRDPTRVDRNSEKPQNCIGTPRQRGTGDEPENVFTPNQTDSNISQNGPRTGQLNSLSSSESGQSSRVSDNSLESRNSGASSSQTFNRLSSSTDQPDTSKSCKDISCDNGVDSLEVNCQRHKVCMDKVNNHNVPSTSGSNKSNDAETSGFRENRKRPSTLKLNRHFEEDSSSDTGNDDYSLGSEDGCIYTYRGGEHLADLPSSFFSLDMGLPLDKHLPLPPNYPVPQQAAPNARERDSRASSPDMDFLEMDFDPGPSCEVDTGDESTPDADLEAVIMPEEIEPVIRGTSPEYTAGARHTVPTVPTSSQADHEVPSTSRGVPLVQCDVEESRSNHVYYGPFITHVNARGEQILVRRTMCHWPHSIPVTLHVSSGDLVSPREMLIYEEDHACDRERPFAHQINQGERPTFDSANLSSALYHLNMAKRLIGENTKSDTENTDAANLAGEVSTAIAGGSGCTASTSQTQTSASATACVETPRCMVWSEREACERQVTQIATSACGATAVVNVFLALGVPVNIDKISSSVGTRQRANNAPLPRYILSRAIAGCTAADLVNGIQRASDGLVTARFFPTYPERAVSLSHWLADWISLGAVPILTLNLQVGCEGEIPDAWHHQMVFGVSPRGIYLCNPVECIRETSLWHRLTSPSVLLVRTRDVLARFTANTDLSPLMVVPDRRFHSFNVLGQVVNVIREWRATGWSEQGTRTRHIRVPASYQAGVTVAALTGSEAHRRLMHAAQLPILAPQMDP